MFRWGAPLTSLKLKIQAAASRPTPQTQNRGRRRVCLGLLGALIPPAAGSPLRRTCRLAAAPPPPHTALLCVHAESNCSALPLFSPPDLSSLRYFSSGLHPRSGGMFERFGPTSAPQHPAPVSLSAPTQQQRPHAQAQNSSWHTMNHQPASLYIYIYM